jgi:hypothetical protein
MQELYDKLVAVSEKLEKLKTIKDVKDHLDEIKLCIQMIDGKQITATNADFCKTIFEDALKEAESTIDEYHK